MGIAAGGRWRLAKVLLENKVFNKRTAPAPVTAQGRAEGTNRRQQEEEEGSSCLAAPPPQPASIQCFKFTQPTGKSRGSEGPVGGGSGPRQVDPCGGKRMRRDCEDTGHVPSTRTVTAGWPQLNAGPRLGYLHPPWAGHHRGASPSEGGIGLGREGGDPVHPGKGLYAPQERDLRHPRATRNRVGTPCTMGEGTLAPRGAEEGPCPLLGKENPGATGDGEGTWHPPAPPAVPVANLFLTSDMRYPALASSTSTPDSVLPSLLNWAATGLGLLGPPRGSQLAESRPQPGGHSGGVGGVRRG